MNSYTFGMHTETEQIKVLCRHKIGLFTMHRINASNLLSTHLVTIHEHDIYKQLTNSTL